MGKILKINDVTKPPIAHLMHANLRLRPVRLWPSELDPLTRLLCHVITRGKRQHSKERKNHDETVSVISLVWSKVR